MLESVELFTIMLSIRSKLLRRARQHAECQHIDLENAQRIEIVLVPFDHGAVFHRGILDRHDLVETVCA